MSAAVPAEDGGAAAEEAQCAEEETNGKLEQTQPFIWF